jgi:hypothetical protein
MKKIFLILFFLLFSKISPIFAQNYQSVPPVQVPSDIVREPPSTNPINSENKTPKFYSNDIDNKSNQFTCPFNFTIWGIYWPYFWVDFWGPHCIEREIDEISNSKTNSTLSTENFRDTAIYWGNHPSTDFIFKNNPNFNSLGSNGLGAAYRSMTADQQKYLKGTIIEEAVLNRKNIKKDTPVLDEQLAWNCNNTCVGLNEKKSGNCKPIYISEIAYYFNKVLKTTTSYKIENNKAIPINFPYDLSGFSATLPDSCYKKLYTDLPIIPRGTVNTKFTIFNKSDQKESQSDTKSFDKGMPLPSSLDSGQLNYVMKALMPANQQITYSTQQEICNNLTSRGAVPDKPSPLSFTAYSTDHNFGTARCEGYVPIPLTPPWAMDNIRGEVTFPKSMIQNMDVFRTFMLNLIPSNIQQKNKLPNTTTSSTTNEDNIPVPDPGYSNEQLYKIFKDSLTPASWQNQ